MVPNYKYGISLARLQSTHSSPSHTYTKKLAQIDCPYYNTLIKTKYCNLCMLYFQMSK